jgi:hypothetical protein
MKVIFSSDANQVYLKFWNVVRKQFLHMGYESKLFLIGDEKPDYLEGEVELVKPLPGVSTVVQALWAKFYFTKTEPETKWFVGDIDQIPLNKNFFDKLDKLDDTYYYCPVPISVQGTTDPNFNISELSKDIPEDSTSVPGYYHIALGKTFIEILDLDKSFEEQIQQIIDGEYGIKSTNNKWNTLATNDWKYFCSEEQFSGEKICKRNDKVRTWGYISSGYSGSLCLPNDLTPEEHKKISSELPMRICRSTNCFFNPFLKDYYIDLHCPRPYDEYKDLIDKIVEFFNKDHKKLTVSSFDFCTIDPQVALTHLLKKYLNL